MNRLTTDLRSPMNTKRKRNLESKQRKMTHFIEESKSMYDG